MSRATIITIGCLLALACGDAVEGTADGGSEAAVQRTAFAEEETNTNDVQSLPVFSEVQGVRVTGSLQSGGIQNTQYVGDVDHYRVEFGMRGWLVVTVNWPDDANVDMLVTNSVNETFLWYTRTDDRPILMSRPMAGAPVILTLVSANNGTPYTLDVDFWPCTQWLAGEYTASTAGDTLTIYTFAADGRYDEELWFPSTGSIYDAGRYCIVGNEMIIGNDEDGYYVFDFFMETEDRIRIGRSTYTR